MTVASRRDPLPRRPQPQSPAGGVSTAAAERTGASILILFVVASVVLGDRAQLNVATGGRGVLPILQILAPLVALGTAARYGSRSSLGFVALPVFLLGVVPYIAMTAVLPVAGVVFNGYPERTLLSVGEATTAVSFLVVGAALSRVPAGSWSPWIVAAILIQLIYATAQALFLAGGPGSELFAPFHAWDLSYAGAADFVQQRSSGLYLNPNELGVWAGGALIMALTLLRSVRRTVAVAGALATLLLSQSRGSTIAVVAALFVMAAIALRRGGINRSGLATVALLAAGAFVALGAVVAVGPPGLLEDRFGGLVDVFVEGPRAEANLAGRLDYWSAVGVLNSLYPWGTGGSPELLLGTAVDSTWFRVFAQGAAPYVAALVLLLFVAVSMPGFTYRRPLVLLTVLLAVAGLTQTPFNYPIGYLFWVLLGAGLEATYLARAARLEAGGRARSSRYYPGRRRDRTQPASSDGRPFTSSR